MKKTSCQASCAARGRSYKASSLMPNSRGVAPSWFGKCCAALSSLRADEALRSGSMFVYVLIILAFLFSFSALVGELYRVHSIQSHLEYEVQRAVNIAVEDAMRDSWRQDKLGKLDTAKATQDVYDYFFVFLGLNGALEKVQDNTLVYAIQIDTLTATEDPPRLHVKGKIFIPSAFPLFSTNVEVPFSISSKNARLD